MPWTTAWLGPWPGPLRGAVPPRQRNRWAFLSPCAVWSSPHYGSVWDGSVTWPLFRPAKVSNGVLHDSGQAATFDFLPCGCDSWPRHWAIRRPHLVFAAAALRALTWP